MLVAAALFFTGYTMVAPDPVSATHDTSRSRVTRRASSGHRHVRSSRFHRNRLGSRIVPGRVLFDQRIFGRRGFSRFRDDGLRTRRFFRRARFRDEFALRSLPGIREEDLLDLPLSGRRHRGLNGRASLNTSPDLILRAVRVMRADLDDDEEELVEFVFNEPVQDILDEGGFLLIGPNSEDIIESDDAVLVKGNPRAVLAGFEPGLDVHSFALGGVEHATVVNRNFEVNVQSTVPLNGRSVRRSRGPTAAPDLIGVKVNPSLEWIHYIFDENLKEGFNGSAADFGFYARSGFPRFGRSIVSIEDNVVTVAFGRGTQVQKGIRYFVLDDAVEDLLGNENVIGAIGSRTTRPDLVGVRQVGDTIFDFVFDEPVSVSNRDDFVVYTTTGIPFAGTGFTKTDATTVRVFFADVDDFGREVVLAAVGPSAVIANDGSADRNTVGAITLNGLRPADVGGTSGPDLVAVAASRADGLVRFTFDEELDKGLEARDVDPEDFLVITSIGELVPGIDIVDVEDNEVVVFFGRSDVDDAIGGSVNFDAVQDNEGNPNPPGTVLSGAASHKGATGITAHKHAPRKATSPKLAASRRKATVQAILKGQILEVKHLSGHAAKAKGPKGSTGKAAKKKTGKGK